MERIQQYDWPGNVRELENTVERELIRHQVRSPDEPLRFSGFDHFSKTVNIAAKSANTETDLPDLDEVIRRHICRVSYNFV